MLERKLKKRRMMTHKILDPFPNDKFIPDGWMDILATVDVCVNEVTPTVFVMRKDLIWFHSKWY